MERRRRLRAVGTPPEYRGGGGGGGGGGSSAGVPEGGPFVGVNPLSLRGYHARITLGLGPLSGVSMDTATIRFFTLPL